MTIFSQHADVLEDFHRRFKYILVDEYQDTNVAQYLWLRLLAQARKNVCCVGDDDQSIYGLARGGGGQHPALRAGFSGRQCDPAGAQTIAPPPTSWAAASGLIAANKGRLGKTLWTEAGRRREGCASSGVWDGEAEARLVADEIERWKKGPLENPGKNTRRYKDAAILVRASFQMRAFEERFVLTQIPYKVIGGPRFFERAEVRDAHAYLRLVQVRG